MTILAVLVTALGTAYLALALARLHRFGEWHHGYLGLLTVLVGLALTRIPWAIGGVPIAAVTGWTIVAVGEWWLWDDAVQHHRQRRDPLYVSPWWRWFQAAVARWPWLGRLSAWLDALVARLHG